MCKTFMEATILILNSRGLEEIDTLLARPSVVVVFGRAVGETNVIIEDSLREESIHTRQPRNRVPVNLRKPEAVGGEHFNHLILRGENVTILDSAQHFQDPAVGGPEATEETCSIGALDNGHAVRTQKLRNPVDYILWRVHMGEKT